MSEEDVEDSDAFVSNAIIVACIIGIIIVTALIVLTPRRKEPFSQLWLRPHKLNLTNASAEDEYVRTFPNPRNTSLFNSSLYGVNFYLFEIAEENPGVIFDTNELKNKEYKIGDTIKIGPNSYFLDALDLEGGQILFWEYPKKIEQDYVRFSFVIENNLGKDHDYRASVILSQGEENVTKAVVDVPLNDSEKKSVAVQIRLTEAEAQEAMESNFTKIITRLDTAEEVFFWIGGNR